MDKVTSFLAWWGAVISTAVFVWDIYKWRKTGRPKLTVIANGNFQDAHSNNPQKYIVVKVTNTGDKPTTISGIAYKFYERKPRKWRKQQSRIRGFFREPISATAQLPYKLDVGADWSGWFLQTKEFENMAREGYLYFEAEDSLTFNAMKNPRARLLID